MCMTYLIYIIIMKTQTTYKSIDIKFIHKLVAA